MNSTTAPTRGSVLVFGVLPPVILNLGAVLIFGTYYALQAVNPSAVEHISPGQVQFSAYLLVFFVEWAFALILMRRMAKLGITLRSLLAPSARLLAFRPLPAIVVFLFVNATLALYIFVATKIYGQWPRLEGLQPWQQAFLVLPVPLTAAFCEELIWRAHLIPEFLSRGRSVSTAIVLAALSFATIHSVFLIDKLIMTFVLAIGMGVYFVWERHLIPLMFSHFVADLWTFALSVL